MNGKQYLNILVGDLTAPEKTFLHRCTFVQNSLNASFVCKAIDNCLRDLDVKREKVLQSQSLLGGGRGYTLLYGIQRIPLLLSTPLNHLKIMDVLFNERRKLS